MRARPGILRIQAEVGSAEESRDLRRAAMLRELAGNDKTIMFDANQHWNLPDALRMCRELSKFSPLWIEEPTHPDDLLAHVELSEAIAPVKIAAGEHLESSSVQELSEVKRSVVYPGRLHSCSRDKRVSDSEFHGEIIQSPVVPHVVTWGRCIST